MELKDIKQVARIMSEHDLTEVDLEQEGFRITLKRGGLQPPVMMQAPAMMAPAMAPAAPAVEPAPAAPQESSGLVEITSPIVGTFYASPAPDAEIFVNVGDHVTEDSPVCIVEAMKVMNEISADVKGTIRKVLVENATPVQFGQALFLVEPD